ncbi:MAG TPA: histidine kinase dimerization/phospho-acceptor domain-containing protein, partial [Caldilineaceae bacterium]|nr:histidine kinase dimerization/phospho-acceptor domain-containing protein [Caldilineaceae bacterium]
MMDPTPHAPAALPSAHTPGDCLAGGGEMGALMRTMDWAATSLGPVEQWPQSLRSAVSICLGSRFPILIWWGPQLVMLYNDAYRPMLGATKHPQALGQAGRSCWPEIWHIIGPMLEQTVMTEGQATWSNDQLLVLDRNNYREECYFTFSYSPIRDESGGVGGVFCAVTETTARVVGERRLRTLRELAAHAGDAKSAAEAGEMAVQTLANNQADLPFVLLYLLDDDGQTATLVGASGLTPGTPASPLRVELPTAAAAGPGWPWAEVIQDGQPLLISDLLARFGPLPGGSWPAPPKQALILPITAATAAQPIGLLVAGISPRRGWDDDYGGFCDLVAGHVATAIANARAYEAERRRAEALAELDRAKSTFFSNVSHEFRTPLTLMLGPLEEILNREEPMLTVADRAQVAMAHRNGLRLLKLGNNLLDFSRIEAGRMQA